MSNQDAKFISKDQNWESEETTYWFETPVGVYGVVESDGDYRHIDQDGNAPKLLSASLYLADAVTDELRSQ